MNLKWMSLLILTALMTQAYFKWQVIHATGVTANLKLATIHIS